MKQAHTSSQGLSELDASLIALVEEISDQLRSGVAVDIEQYVQRHPDQAESLRTMYNALIAVTMLGTSDNDEVTLSAEPAQPQQLGDFRIVREIGRGGMGVVYEAEQLSLGRQVALKVLPFASLLEKHQLERFKNEVRAAAMLKHPHIVSVYQTGYDRGVHYYAMELIEGQTLADHIQSLRRTMSSEPSSNVSNSLADDRQTGARETVPIGALSTQTPTERKEFFRNIARLGVQAARAFHYANQQGVIHRDIKPSNLLLDASGELYITDFGLARTHATGNLTLTGDLIGTLRYMSPEQLNDASVVDHRTDIYSLGITLYELLALRPAFPQNNRADLTRNIIDTEPRALRSIDHNVPQDLETIVVKSIAKEADQRYSSMQQLAEDLERFLNCEPIRARAPSLSRRVAKWLHRNQMLAWVSALGMFIIACIASLAWLREGQLRREHERADANLELAWRSVFVPPQDLARRTDPAIDVTIVNDSIAAMNRLEPQVPVAMRRDFDIKLAELLLTRAEYLLHQGRDAIGDARRAIELLQRWLTMEATPNHVGELLLMAFDAQAYYFTVDLRMSDALAAHRQRLGLADQINCDDQERIWVHGIYGAALRLSGQIHDAEMQCRIAMDYWRHIQDKGTARAGEACLCHSELIETLMNLGRWDEIQSLVAGGDELADGIALEPNGLVGEYWYACYRLCSARVANSLGAPDRAISILHDLIRRVESRANSAPSTFLYPFILVRCKKCLSQSYVLQADWEQAEQMTLETIRLSTVQSPPRFMFQLEEAMARNQLAHILFATGRRRQARDELMTAIGELKVICSLRPEDPRCNRDLLALLATCPFDDLRDAHQQTVIAAKLMSDETGWFRYCLSLASYWNGDFDQALDIVAKRPGAAQHDAIGQLITSMALARLGDLDSARRAFNEAEDTRKAGAPMQYGGMFGPCIVDFLRTEARTLLDASKN